MSSTVRIDEDAKVRLRRLQDAWERARGERPSQKDLLSEGLAYLERHSETFLSEAAWEPWGDEQIARLRGLIGRYGDSEPYDIDEIVYGEGGT